MFGSASSAAWIRSAVWASMARSAGVLGGAVTQPMRLQAPRPASVMYLTRVLAMEARMLQRFLDWHHFNDALMERRSCRKFPRQEFTNVATDFRRVGFQCKMSRVQKMNLGVG